MLNPYREGSISSKIYERNYVDPGQIIESANYKDKFIIYLYVMGRTIGQIAEFMGVHRSTVSKKLDKYGVKYDI